MNFNELFPVQQKLDNKIVGEKGLGEQDLKKKKVVALLTELFECVNEARFFKFWSKNQKARNHDVKCHACNGKGEFISDVGHFIVKTELCGYCDRTGIQERSPLLEEYVDTIHFVLSIAIEYGYTQHEYKEPISIDLNDRVISITYLVSSLPFIQEKVRHHQLSLIFDYVISLGYQLGFTEGQVIAAYYDKNKINHQRQEQGY